MKKSPLSQFPPVKSAFRVFGVFCGLSLLCCGCQVLSYSSPTGERFSRSSLGTTTAISSLTVESGTNGLRRVHLHGYQSDGTQALGVITEAAVRGAVSAAKP